MATEVDYGVEHAVREFPSRETSEIGFLGEEEGISRLGDGLMWALDPVDGTANFLHDIPLCGVSLGLVDKDTPTLGVIDLPFLNLRYAAAEEAGAFANGTAIRVSDAQEMQSAIVAIGNYAVGENAGERNRPRLALTQELAARVQCIRMFGSAAIDLAWVAHGRIDAAIMLSNNTWDTAAGRHHRPRSRGDSGRSRRQPAQHERPRDDRRKPQARSRPCGTHRRDPQGRGFARMSGLT